MLIGIISSMKTIVLKGFGTFKMTLASCDLQGLKTPYPNFQAPALNQYIKNKKLSFQCQLFVGGA